MATLESFDNTLGALFVGFSVSAVIYGSFLVQAYCYYRRYPSDKVGYQAIVALLLLLETVHQAFIGHSVYYYSVTNYMNTAVLIGKPVWSVVFQLLIEAVVAALVKFFFSLRVWRFSYGNIWLTAFLLLLDFGQLGLAVFFTVKSYETPALVDLVNLRPVGIVALAIGVLNDAAIAIFLCYYLQKMRSRHSQSNSIIRHLMLYAVNTGIMTSLLSFVTLLIYNFMPRNFIFVGFYFVLSKLYGVSFIAALNTRQITRQRYPGGEPNKSPAFERGTNGHNRSLSIPLQTHIVERDSWQVHGEEENAPGFSNVDSAERERPCYYSAGW